ncbi:SDR family NAD(P)-dependent oxidoreductase [Streptomyces hundungensis]|uniref:SDR family NAD(P)-dependent oxidoreductase n=1 Tax=Streptomyces hundungensis TaxID=1077946 RepID=UPI00340CB3B9
MIKTALALHHKLLPPTINVDMVSEAVNREALYVNKQTRPWVREPHRSVRRGGVSAFGFGGVNFHAILEEYAALEAPAEVWHTAPSAHLWHAPDVESLLALLRVDNAPETGGPIPAEHVRLGVVAEGELERASLVAQAIDRLEADPAAQSWELPGRASYRREPVPSGTKVAALFAGQGSQYVNMGKRALLAIPPVRAAFDAANALWHPQESESETLADVVFPTPDRHDQRVDTAKLRRTSYAQAAIGALAMGQYRFLTELGLTPDGMLGHSCGEVTALWAAGSLSDEGCLTLTRRRGQAMEPADRTDGYDSGAMIALRASREVWNELGTLHPELTLCNINAPDEFVVGGPTPAVEALAEHCRTRGLVTHRLSVAGAFHTPMVKHAADAFAEAVTAVGVLPPTTQVLPGFPGASYGVDPAANRLTLSEQMLRPVDFEGRVRDMYADGFRVFVEFGPGQVLSRLVSRIVEDPTVEAIATDGGAGADSAAMLTYAALRLAVMGLEIRDINRYQATPALTRAATSPVARLLEGPSFAVEARRAQYESVIADTYECTPASSREQQSTTPSATTPLSDAATNQLELHARYLEGQLHTARRLTDLVSEDAGGEPGASLLAQVEAVKEHSLALSRAHIHAQDVMLELVRLGQHEHTPVAAAVEASAGRDALRVESGAIVSESAPPEAVVPLPRQPLTASAVPKPDVALDTAGTKAEPADGVPPATGPDAPLQPAAWTVDVAQAEQILRELVAEKTGYTVEMVSPDLDIQADLGIDSLKQVEIASEAWRRYPFLPREQIYRFAQARTVGELALLLTEIVADATATPHSGHQSVPVGRGYLTLEPLPEADALADAYRPQPTALVLDDGSELAGAVSAALSAQGWELRTVPLPGTATDSGALDDWREDTLRERITAVLGSSERLDLCVLPAGRGVPSAGAEAAIARLSHAVLVAKHVTPVLKDTVRAGYRAAFMAVTQLDGALGLDGSGGDEAAALLGGLGGLVKAVGVEEPELFCRAVDVAPELDPAAAAARFVTETTDASRVSEVAWDGTRRACLAVTPALAEPPSPEVDAAPKATDLLVVTGGARGITAWCCTALAAERTAGFVLLGRTALTEMPAWADGHDDPAALTTACRAHAAAAGRDVDSPEVCDAVDAEVNLVRQQSEIRATLAALRAQGAEATYVAADVADPSAVVAALTPYADRVTGVIHGAGVLADKPLSLKTPQDVARVVDTKLTGLLNVLAALPAENLRHLVVFTSVSGIYGNGRQTDYAMANEALNRFACAWQTSHPSCEVSAMAWGPWQGGMASDEAQALFTQLGIELLTREQGCAYFSEELAAGSSSGTVSVLGPMRSVFRAPALPSGGITVLRDLDGLAKEPVLVDHSIDGLPVLPMTAAIGWGVNVTERLRVGRPVTEVRDFQVRKGLVLDGSQPPRAQVVVQLGDDPATELRLAFHDDGVRTPLPRYEGVFRTAEKEAAPTGLRLPAVPSQEAGTHPAYRDGFLFHGPLLQGLGAVLAQDDAHLTIAAQLSDPHLAHGAYEGRLYSPALADLLLQAAALLGRRVCGHRCLPVAVERIELFAPLPDDEPFVIVVELLEREPLELTCTVTACHPQGDVLQRWHAVKGIVAAPQLGSRAAWPAPRTVRT